VVAARRAEAATFYEDLARKPAQVPVGKSGASGLTALPSDETRRVARLACAGHV
jgi:hypothetical protein